MDVFVRLLKIGFIFNFLTTATSWNFFSTYFLELFEQGGYYLKTIIFNQQANLPSNSNNNFESSIFGYMNDTIGYLLNPNLWLMITSLVGSIGFVLALCLMYSIFILLKIIFQMIISYIFALISFSLVASVAPIFIAFFLFDRTKNYFRMWYQQLFYFMLQPILMFMTTLFFFSIINVFLSNVMSFKVCKTIYPLVIEGLPTLASLMYYENLGLSIFNLVPSIISLLCLTKLMERAADFGGSIASSLTSTEGPSLSLTGKHSIANSITNIIGNTTQKLLGIDKESRSRIKYASQQNKKERDNRDNNAAPLNDQNRKDL